MALCLNLCIDDIGDKDSDLRRIAKEYGLDVKAVEAEARAAVGAKYAVKQKPAKSKASKAATKQPAKARTKTAKAHAETGLHSVQEEGL